MNNVIRWWGVLIAVLWFPPVAAVQSIAFFEQLLAFEKYYAEKLGAQQRCSENALVEVKVCSARLRNDGNAPFLLHHGKPTDVVVTLFHGLSDSPFYLRSIAKGLHDAGFTVVVALVPGHGLTDADQDMQDPQLSERWMQHASEVMTLSANYGTHHYIGGASSGGAIAALYSLQNADDVAGLLLFSGALALANNAEQLSRIWGMQTIAKWLDGDYVSDGENPYRYPEISLFAVYELMEVIRNIRKKLQSNSVNIPTFAAHSAADLTAPFSGVEDFLALNRAEHNVVLIDEQYTLCHSHLTLDTEQVKAIDFPEQGEAIVDACLVPRANPLHGYMMAMLVNFIQQNQKSIKAE
ncbi:alpha/beta hydrolase [Alteromonas sp. ASW11-36]|uniref:Alpha/beta hydrolase n=1 Tax=Alteromonas arenosi TaxID=3055817 RepID=A0ABT7STK4_9ALTE|nr:alpha/beta hydrolase [Alteromonas sp. ASW11-36]MDM7859518.1 alpha/beta hydrolase [Alteromonas sp. ASW11-36]